MAQQQKPKQQKTAKKVVWEFPLTRENWYILAGGLVLILIGFGLMATAITSDPQERLKIWDNPLAISVAPVVLVIGFLGVIPFGLFWRKKSPEQTQQDQ